MKNEKVVKIDNFDIEVLGDKIYTLCRDYQDQVVMDIDTAQKFAKYVLDTYGIPEDL